MRDLPDLLDPERPHLRLAAGGEIELADRGAGQMAPGALGQHGGLGGDVGARLEVAQRVAVLAAALVARADAAHGPVLDQQLRGRRLGEDVGAGLLGLLGQPARELGDRDDVVAVVAERRRRRLERQGPVGAQHPVDRVLGDLAVGRPVLGLEIGEELLEPRRAHHRAGQVVGAAHLALLDDRHRHLAEALHDVGPTHPLVGQQLQELVGARQAGGAAADDGDAHLDALLLVVELALDELLLRVDSGRELSGRDDPAVRRRHAAQPFFALMASVSLGTILLRSPTIPRSENSKIGAFASLLIATMFSADCMPTLCWMAPEMPAAR